MSHEPPKLAESDQTPSWVVRARGCRVARLRAFGVALQVDRLRGRCDLYDDRMSTDSLTDSEDVIRIGDHEIVKANVGGCVQGLPGEPTVDRAEDRRDRAGGSRDKETNQI